MHSGCATHGRSTVTYPFSLISLGTSRTLEHKSTNIWWGSIHRNSHNHLPLPFCFNVPTPLFSFASTRTYIDSHTSTHTQKMHLNFDSASTFVVRKATHTSLKASSPTNRHFTTASAVKHADAYRIPTHKHKPADYKSLWYIVNQKKNKTLLSPKAPVKIWQISVWCCHSSVTRAYLSWGKCPWLPTDWLDVYLCVSDSLRGIECVCRYMTCQAWWWAVCANIWLNWRADLHEASHRPLLLSMSGLPESSWAHQRLFSERSVSKVLRWCFFTQNVFQLISRREISLFSPAPSLHRGLES